MRSTVVAVIALLFVSSVPAQTLHQATPVDQLLKQIHAHHHLIAEMEPLPGKIPDGFNAAAVKAFTITAHQFDFTINPSAFVVNVGDSVTLDITSSDVTHGFFLEHYMTGLGVTMSNGQHRTVSFVADTPGAFTYACTQPTCGEGHSDMVGDLVVQAAATAPTISGFTPTSGPTAGGTVVAITGSTFQNGASVKFDTSTAVSVTVNSPSSISAMTPAHAAGDVTITVTNPDGQSATVGAFAYTVPGPTITSISPATGSTVGGTAITISGTNFVAGATVTIGGTPASNVSIPNSTTINATTPLGPFDIASSVARDVVVTNPDGRSVTRSGGFTYTLPAPSIASISPNATSPNGGTQVTINGSGFTTALPVSVTFGGVAGTNALVTSPVTLNVTAPAHAAGTVDVVVRVGSVQATSTGAFSYQTPSKKRRAVKLQ